MIKVYLVSSGRYSDYGIEQVFSTKEKAEEYIRLSKEYSDESLNEIEEYELDPQIKLPHHFKFKYFYNVYMDRYGNVNNSWKAHIDILNPEDKMERYHFSVSNDYSFSDGNKEYVVLGGTVNANDQEHAIKIMNEKRLKLLQEGRWINEPHILRLKKLNYAEIKI